MFKKKVKVVEYRTDSGIMVTHYLEGKKKDIDERIRQFRLNCKMEATFGKLSRKGLVVWV